MGGEKKMDKNAGRKQKVERRAVWFLKSLLCAYIVTGILISSFSGGFVMGKLSGNRKFLWGLVTGTLYFALLIIISLGLYRSVQSDLMNLATTFLLCAGGGMLGGMVS